MYWIEWARAELGAILNASSADLENGHGRRLLNTLLLGVTAATVLMLVAVVVAASKGEVGERGEVTRLSFGIVVTLFGVVVISLLKRYKSAELSSSLSVMLLLIAIAISNLPIQIVRGRSLALLAIPLLVSSLLLRPWASFVLAALSSLMILVIGLNVQPFANVPALVAFFVLVVVSWLSTQGLERALEGSRLANRKLQNSEARYRALFDGVPVGLFRVAPSGQFLAVNQALVDMLGDPDHESLLAVNSADLYVRAQDRDRWRSMLEREEAARDFEAQWQRYDGMIIDARTSIRVERDVEGHALYYEGSLEDITESKRAEQLLQTLNTAALAMEQAVTHEGILSAVAQEFEKLGFSCMVLLTDKSQERLVLRYLSFAPPLCEATEKLTGLQAEASPVPVEAVGPFAQAIREQKACFVANASEIVRHVLLVAAEECATQLDEVLQTQRLISAPLVVEDKVIGVLSVHSADLTEGDVPGITAFAHQLGAAWHKAQLMLGLRQSLQDLTEAQAQLLQVQKLDSIGRVAGGIAHDFSNLLTVILGYAQLGQGKLEPTHPVHTGLKDIEMAARRGAKMTGQLLAFSRRQILQKRVLDLNELISEFSKMLVRMIREDIQLHLDLAPQLERTFADGNALEQVLMNLALNARDAMPEGGILCIATAQVEIDEVYCQTHPEAKPGNYLRLTVADTGIGMDDEAVEHLFEPFFTTKEPGRGTGLGLPMAYGIVKQHDGWIEVESVVGQGTTVHVYVPVHQGGVTEAAEEPKALALPTGRGTILLAEDEPKVQEFGRSVLEELGYSVLTARDGKEAVEVFAANRDKVDLIILDAVMPKLSGSKARRAIRALRADVPVLFITGYSEEIARLTSAESTTVHILRKPFGRAELGRKVREVLDEAERVSSVGVTSAGGVQ